MKTFSVRSIFRWFDNLSYLLESIYYSLVNWKNLSKSTFTDDHHQSSENSETWNGFPDVVIKKIFGKLMLRDRARMKSVSKSWNQILNRVDIPSGCEVPWLILSNDTYSKTESLLTEISMEICFPQYEKNYVFKLPKFYEDVPAGGCLCGTSNGWLVIATAGPKLKPDMFLWSPLSGTTHKLPLLSTIPFLNGLRPKLNDLPSFTKRVEVFPQENHCIVAVLFSHPTNDRRDCLALCTPQEKRWSIMEGDYYRYRDILHHNGKLYALARNDEDEEEEKKMNKTNSTIYLSSRSKYCEVKVCVLRLKYKLSAQKRTKYNEDGRLISRSFNVTYANECSEYLVECSTTGQLLVVAAIFDSYKYNSNGDGPGESFMCHKTSKFEVRFVENLEIVNGTGNQSLFIASTGSLSMPSSTEGLLPDYIFFATDDAQGLVGDQDQRIIARENGSFSLLRNAGRPFPQYLKFPVQSKSGWFKPTLV